MEKWLSKNGACRYQHGIWNIGEMDLWTTAILLSIENKQSPNMSRLKTNINLSESHCDGPGWRFNKIRDGEMKKRDSRERDEK